MKLEIKKEQIILWNLESLIKYTGYRKGREIPEGFVLDKKVIYQKPGKSEEVLLSEEIPLNSEKIGHLIKFQENKKHLEPNLHFDSKFYIKKNSTLVDNLRNDIKKDFRNIIDAEKKGEFNEFMENIDSSIIDDILKEDNIVYCLRKAKFEDIRCYNHSINTMLFSLGIGSLSGLEKKNLVDLGKIALLHDVGAWMSDDVNDKTYLSLRSGGGVAADNLGLSQDVRLAIQNVGNYPSLKFFVSEDGLIPDYSNIVVAAEQFEGMRSGFFAEETPSCKAVDKLYIMATEGDLDEEVINKLSQGLGFDYLFDFYAELRKIIRKCGYGEAVPYPFEGFFSTQTATSVLCGINTSCDTSNISTGVVTLFEKVSGLKAGSYAKCTKLSEQVMDLYDNYRLIKEQALQRLILTKVHRV